MNSPHVVTQRAQVEEFQRKHRIGLLALVFTDIVDSTRLKQQHGDAQAVMLIQRHHELVRETLAQFAPAEEIETAGDSFLLVFAKPSDAVRFALVLRSRLQALAVETGVAVLDRIGIHVGEVFIEEQKDTPKLFGMQVDTCARVASLGQANQILMTRFAFDNARQVLKGQTLEGIGPLQWVSHGFYAFKGVAEPLEICEVAEAGATPPARPADSEKARRTVAPRPATSARRRRVPQWLLVSLILLLTLAVLFHERALTWFGGLFRPQTRLVVLPFLNEEGGTNNEAFCDGLADALAAELSKLERFEASMRIIPMSYVVAEKITTPHEAHQVLGASRVLFGRVRRDPSQVRIELNLLDPTALTRTFQAAIAQSSSDLSGLQDKVVNEVVRMLQLEPSAKAHQVLAAGQTKTSGAYEAYVQALGKLARYDLEANLDAAIVLLNRALEQDADYALAHAALGETYWRKYELTKEPTRIAEARFHCAQALKLDPESAEAHTTVGIIESGTGNYDQAVAEFQTALRLDPPNLKALRELAQAYKKKGQVKEAEAAFLKAIAQRPEDWATHKELGVFYWRLGRYPEAANSFREVTRLNPDSYSGHRNLGGLYFLMDKMDEAAAELNQSLSLKKTPEAFSNLGTIFYFVKADYAQAAKLYEQAIALGNPGRVLYGNLGDAYRNAPGLASKAPAAYRQAVELTEKNLEVNPKDAEERSSLALYRALLGDSTNALREIRRALEIDPENVNVMAVAAQVYETAGDRPTALRWLAVALKRGYSRTAIERDPDFAKLRQDPQYQTLEFPPSQNTNHQTQP